MKTLAEVGKNLGISEMRENFRNFIIIILIVKI